MKRQITHIIFLVFSALCFQLNAKLSLPSILSDNMVLQANSSADLWGNASPGKKISITVSWNKRLYSTTANAAGKWFIKIHTPKETPLPRTITFREDNVVKVHNILIGEVWLCSGQSNMDFPVAKGERWQTGVINEKETLADADYPQIRLFHVVQKISNGKELDDCEGKWVICNKDNIRDFSAVAFFFGRKLFKNIHCPVGLIQSSWGGTPAEAWTKFSVIENDPIYSDLLLSYKKTEASYPSDLKKYEEELARYESLKNKGDTSAKAPKKPQGNNYNKALSVLWNGMIRPLIPFTLKGVIWYQGESNAIRYWNYTKAFTNMINSWRKEWNEGDFPFYFVQIAPQYKQPPGIREAQLRTWESVKNTGMVVITDVGDSTNIHPRNKQVVGERLANWALAKDYGMKIAYSGPLFQSCKMDGDKAILSFDFANALNQNQEN